MTNLTILRQTTLEPKRLQYTKQQIEALGYTITFESETELQFIFNHSKVFYFPYSGWHSGKSIKDGRGLKKLLDQIKTAKPSR